jgi:hypothetical protein
MRYYLLLILLTLSFGFVHGQGIYQYSRNLNVKVNNGTDTLTYAWAGGINCSQFQTIDLDFDGDEDLVIFERNGNKINTFKFENGGYIFAPEFRAKFPPDIKEWLIIRDYNQDGLKDLYSYFSGGAMLYKNSGNMTQGLQFVKVAKNLRSNYGTIVTNIYISSVDIPAIDDIDGDGDTDVLTYNVLGSCLEYHMNLSQELYGNNDSLNFVLVTGHWGNFKEDPSSNGVTLNDSCSGQKSDDRHVGSTLLSFDINGDGLKDLLVGDNTYSNLVLLINGGTTQEANMTVQQTDFPFQEGGSEAVNLFTFPAAKELDVDRDGLKDLIITPSTPGQSENKKSVWYYKNIGTSTNASYQLQSKDFMQHEMLDFGEGAWPVLFDADSDGLLDLLVSNFGYYDNATYLSKIAYYRNSGSATTPSFTLVTEDYQGLSASGFGAMMPTFGDLDGDGDKDMVIGEKIGFIHYYENIAPNGQPAQFVLSVQNLGGIQEPGFSAPFLFDLNEDGLLDIINGSRLGRLNYYRNTGSQTQAQFSTNQAIASLGGVYVIDSSLSFNSYSIPYIFEDGGDFQLFCGTHNGRVFHYKNIKGNITGSFDLVTKSLGGIFEGIRSSVGVGDLNSDGKYDLVIGNYNGGVGYFDGLTENTGIAYSLVQGKAELFPNPATEQVNVYFGGANKGIYSLINIQGQTVRTGIISNGGTLSLDDVQNGIYLIKIENGNRRWMSKLVKQ